MLRSLKKLFLSNWVQNGPNHGFQHISTQAFPLQFKASPALWAEPLKKKKKLDPAIAKAKEERRKKRILKEIRKLQKQEKVLKPISDFELPPCLQENLEIRRRKIEVPVEVKEERVLLLKEWTRMKRRERTSDFKIIQRLMKSQQNALDELRIESEELYQAAVKIDESLIPLKYTGPSETPAKEDYTIPDGTYLDVSRKWE